jgi:hypothetical protein
MSAPPRDRSAWSARFALETLDDGALLVDLESGTYFELNRTAAEACRALLEASGEAASRGGEPAARLATRLGIEHEEAARMLDAVANDLAAPADVRDVLVGPFRYVRRGELHFLEDQGHRVLEINLRARTVAGCADATPLRFSMLEYVRAVTPKLLRAQDVMVLHASACRWADRVIAFSGPSGAGKTTTMRAFAAAGATAISEDLVVLAAKEAHPSLYEAGEANAHAWAADTADGLCRNFRRGVSFSPLLDAARGPTLPLSEIWLVDASRRGGRSIALDKLGKAASLIALLRNTFLGVDDVDVWRKHLHELHALADMVPVAETSLPEGLSPLAEGARAYVTNSAS